MINSELYFNLYGIHYYIQEAWIIMNRKTHLVRQLKEEDKQPSRRGTSTTQGDSFHHNEFSNVFALISDFASYREFGVFWLFTTVKHNGYEFCVSETGRALCTVWTKAKMKSKLFVTNWFHYGSETAMICNRFYQHLFIFNLVPPKVSRLRFFSPSGLRIKVPRQWYSKKSCRGSPLVTLRIC